MRSPKEALAELKRRASEQFEGIADDVRMQTAMRMRSDPRILERWMAFTGAEDPDGIDYDDPCVQIEYLACDPTLHNLAGRDGKAFVERTGCDEATFMRYYDQSAEKP